jgi:hypothetical protein
MAANPQYTQFPEDRPVKRQLKLVKTKKPFPWDVAVITVAALVAAAILIAIRWTTIHAPAAAAGEAAREIQLTDVTMAPAPAPSAFYLDGVLHNNGKTEITAVDVQATFVSPSGKIAATVTRAIQGTVGGSGGDVEDLAYAPVRAGERRRFRIFFGNHPPEWNHQVPPLKVMSSTAGTPDEMGN